MCGFEWFLGVGSIAVSTLVCVGWSGSWEHSATVLCKLVVLVQVEMALTVVVISIVAMNVNYYNVYSVTELNFAHRQPTCKALYNYVLCAVQLSNILWKCLDLTTSQFSSACEFTQVDQNHTKTL